MSSPHFVKIAIFTCNMADIFTQSQRHDCMAKVRSKGTTPEVTLRRCLHRRGLRFRVNVKSLPGTPDIVLAKYHTIIFVNGCFWHGHDGCKYYTHPKTNSEFWADKVKRNIERDLEISSRLEYLNWHVITIWECELKKGRLDETINRLMEQLRTNLESWNQYNTKRKEDRAFALKENRRRRLASEAKEAEIQNEFHIPRSIVRLSKRTED